MSRRIARAGPGLLIPAVCVLGGLLLVGAELLNTFRIENEEGQAVALVGGAGRHGFSLGVVGLLGAAAALTAALTASRAAATAAAVAGLAALALIAAIDLPDLGAADLVRDPDGAYVRGEAIATSGFWLSLIAATLLTIGGALLATLSPAQLRNRWTDSDDS